MPDLLCTSMYCSRWLPGFDLWKALGTNELYKGKMVEESRKSHEANKVLQVGKIRTCNPLNRISHGPGCPSWLLAC